MNRFYLIYCGLLIYAFSFPLIAQEKVLVEQAAHVVTDSCVPSSSVSKANIPILSDIDRQLLQRISRLFQVFCHQSASLWNTSYRLDQMPLLLVYRDAEGKDRHAYLLNHPHAKQLASAEPLVFDPSLLPLPPMVKLTTLPRAEGLNQNDLSQLQYAEFQWPLAGVPTLVVFYRDSGEDSFSIPTSASWDAFLIHEGLHHHQEGLWRQRDDELQNVRDYPLAQVDIADILLETQALLSALSAKTEEGRRQAVRHFVSVRTARMTSDPIIHGMDGTQERYEGTAHYLEHRLKAIIPNSAIPDVATLLRGNLSIHGNRLSLAFGRFYASGAALSMLLDQLAIDWKPLMASGETHYDILVQWLGDHSAQQQWLQEARTTYDYPSLLIQADSMAERIAKTRR